MILSNSEYVIAYVFTPSVIEISAVPTENDIGEDVSLTLKNTGAEVMRFPTAAISVSLGVSTII